MSFFEMVQTDHLFIFPDETRQDVILEIMAKSLWSKGFVHESYVNAVKDREKHYPTGLELADVHVAIPHTDACHVKQQTIALGVVKQGTKFHCMADASKTISVKLIIMLAIEKSEAHLEMLEEIMTFIQDASRLEALSQASTPVEFFSVIQPANSYNH
ncbi:MULTISPECIES: PTS sugar transporter subunit IIA [Brevibacillus]|uniref:PTS sugar transporter subunit IIA n=1 Tax=Brevibacillus laterosporus TaxID=1465 RepID=A0AAP3DI58_BRELA|nr:MULTISPECIES: PTS sugar transporter subunit IIA [Brevibacillus]ATO51183.1 PTS sugar transporter subunit IIA [Brevibacillus laterosporus DSM 25]AYB38675.1 PTS sugar transporter subunit IIA [Brevibacillus laterosporus]MBG9790871.1 PTS sugar transporter subunit IIA [Brevibacillus laterosporus]MBG9797434.1 PTS sugar transporter subunit IIA [Brevibacillus laterosporus]MBG9804118.1 PTS sugar transporter subunit IIA [Brevibacillus laterosporus]